MSAMVLKILQERREELAAIDSPGRNWSVVTQWGARTRPIIAGYFAEELKFFDRLVSPTWSHPRARSMSGESLDGLDHNRINENIAENARMQLLNHMDALIELIGIEDSNEQEKASILGEKVFLVHGHNNRWLNEVARFIGTFDLDIVILREQPNKGRTIIEKFEDHASEVGFAVVLLTGDDKGGLRDGNPEGQRLRARQNVILELGFFLGKLGRARVCALYEDGVEIPSDYSGVLFVPIDEVGGWKMLLAKEMKVAGLPVDLNRTI